jgi:hypothetical protein
VTSAASGAEAAELHPPNLVRPGLRGDPAHHGWFFTDELELSQISRAGRATGHGARRGQPYFWQTLYTWLIAPGWRIHSTTLAYAVVQSRLGRRASLTPV